MRRPTHWNLPKLSEVEPAEKARFQVLAKLAQHSTWFANSKVPGADAKPKQISARHWQFHVKGPGSILQFHLSKHDKTKWHSLVQRKNIIIIIIITIIPQILMAVEW